MQQRIDPQIYVACLSSYNAGKLHGVWIDLDGKDADDIEAEVKDMLAASPMADAEEWRIDDTNDLDGYTPSNLEEAAAIGECINRTDNLAVIHWLKHGNAGGLSPWEYEERLRDDYLGVYASETDFIEDQLRDEGIAAELEKIQIGDQTAWQYLDVDAIAGDWMISAYFSQYCSDEGYYIFRRS